MASPDVRDLLASFSPSSNFFAISSGDGRIKIWDYVRGQLQTEFADVTSSDASSMLSDKKSGHLSLDYVCMKWVQLESKKKKKGRNPLLVLGTGGGDVLALDVSAGQLRWRVSDCHAGGVSAVSSPVRHSCIYTAGSDGMVCQIDISTGSVLGRFRSSAKSISTMTVSADGKILATAAGQLKIFNCLDNKKIQKFSGHPVIVRCLIFSEDGKHILSSGVGERHIAIWKVGSGKKQSAISILSMEHPAVFLDSKCLDSDGKDGAGITVLAISEAGVCYLWNGCNVENLQNSWPTKISLFVEPSLAKKSQGLGIFAAKLQDVAKHTSGQVLVAYGSLVKPSFDKLMVQYGTDINLEVSKGGVLLPLDNSSISQKGPHMQMKVTALDHANAEDAILPLPKLYAQGKKRKHSVTQLVAELKNAMADPVSNKNKACLADNRVNYKQMEEDGILCIEDRLREAGIISNKVDISMQNHYTGANVTIYENTPAKKIRARISSMSQADAYNFLEVLVSMWKQRCWNDNRSTDSKLILPWIYCILVKHGHYIVSQESSAHILDSLEKMTRLRSAAIESLLKLSGRFRMIMNQIDNAGNKALMDDYHGDGGKVDEEDDEDEDVDEMVYGDVEDESQSSSDEDNERQP